MAAYDLLGDWLDFREREIPLELLARDQAETRATLRQLERLLDDLPPGRPNGLIARHHFGGPAGLPLGDVSRVHDLYRRILRMSGEDTTVIEESLLRLLADTEAPASVPFWLEILDLERPGDAFATMRQDMALAALARLAIGRRLPDAYRALSEVVHHTDTEVRARALHYLRRAYAESEEMPPTAVCDDLLDIALSDEHFGPRYLARLALHAVDLPLPVDYVGGAYNLVLRSELSERDGYRIEMRSEQSLEELHLAIQYVIGWDTVRRYSFHLRGRAWDGDYTIRCPQEGGSVRYTDEALIGELGLAPDQRLLYLFDYGQGDHCEVEVVGICREAGSGAYPRVLDPDGQPVPPYRLWYLGS